MPYTSGNQYGIWRLKYLKLKYLKLKYLNIITQYLILQNIIGDYIELSDCLYWVKRGNYKMYNNIECLGAA